MKMSLKIECDCGNLETYRVEYKYHSHSADSHTDLAGAIYDDKFQAKPIASGTFVNCRKCQTGFKVV